MIIIVKFETNHVLIVIMINSKNENEYEDYKIFQKHLHLLDSLTLNLPTLLVYLFLPCTVKMTSN